MLLALLMVKLVCVCVMFMLCAAFTVSEIRVRFTCAFVMITVVYYYVIYMWTEHVIQPKYMYSTHRFIYINISCFRCTQETEREKGINRHNIHQIVAYVIYILSTWTYSYIRTYIDWSYRLFIYLYIITLDCRRVNSLLYSHYSTNIVCNAFASHILSIVW